MKSFVDNSECAAIFYKEIFESLKDLFVGTQVTNHYFFAGLNEILPFALYTAQEIKEHFVSFKDFNIEFLFLRCPEVIRIDNEKFMHASA